jgi:hypothetical protein
MRESERAREEERGSERKRERDGQSESEQARERERVRVCARERERACIFMHTCMHVCVHARVCACRCVCAREHTWVCIHADARACMRECVPRACTHDRDTHMNTLTVTHSHTCATDLASGPQDLNIRSVFRWRRNRPLNPRAARTASTHHQHAHTR